MTGEPWCPDPESLDRTVPASDVDDLDAVRADLAEANARIDGPSGTT